MDDPEWIIKLVAEYPWFQALYREVYELCRNGEAVMEFYSKELLMLDRNTVQLMIDEMQENLDRQKNYFVYRNKSSVKEKGSSPSSSGKRMRRLYG